MVRIDVSGTLAAVRSCDTLTVGQVGEVVEFRFDAAWEGLQKTAVFRQGRITKDRLDIGQSVQIPWEVLHTAGMPVEIGVYGVSEDGKTVIPTVWAKTKPVQPGADPSGDESADPTLPVWEYVLQKAVKEATDAAVGTTDTVAIVCEGSGTAITATDASDLPLRKLRLLGKTTLSGTPTPTAPAVMDSVPESVTVSINDGQDLTLTVAQPLRGIPMQAVCTKHNYTDTSGQKWFTDEIDLARGVYIQRCFTIVFDGTEGWYLASGGEPSIGSVDYPPLKAFDIGAIAPDNGCCAYHMCSHFRSVPRNGSKPNGTVNAFGGTHGNTLQFKTDTYNGDLEGWKQYLTDQAAAGTPVTMLLGMKTPVETALPEEVIQAYKALHTMKGETIIGNDASAYMEASYVADTKLYIDQKLAAISAALLNN